MRGHGTQQLSVLTMRTKRKSQSRQLLRSGALLVSTLLLIYVFGFNFLPPFIRTPTAILLLAGYVILFIGATLQRRPGRGFISFGLFILLMIGVLNLFGSESSNILVEFPRFYSSLIGFSAYILLPTGTFKTSDAKTFQKIALVLVIFSIYQAFANEEVLVGSTYRMGSITGGLTVMHPSAYAALALVFIFAGFWKNDISYRLLSALGIFVSVYLVYGFGVRTVWTMGAIFILVLFIYSNRYRTLYAMGVSSMIALFLVTTVFVLDKEFWLSVMDVGSGRIGTYIQRSEIIASRGARDLLLGTGIGSDSFEGKYVWRSEAKDSHNDYLSLLIEFGIIGFAGLIFYVAGLIRASRDKFSVAILVALLFASLISNAALFRPNLGALYGLAICLWILRQRGPNE